MKQILLLILITLSFSCKKYLDQKSDHRFLIPSTLNDISLLIANLEALNLVTVPTICEATDNIQADSVQMTSVSGPNLARSAFLWDLKDHPLYQYNNGMSWARPYNAIYYANLCLEKLPKITRTDKNAREWDRLYGSALFFRAYHMAQLCWTFAKNYDENNNTNPGIVIKLENDFNQPSVRSTVQESYRQLLKDATESLNYLEMNSETKFLPNKKAVFALLSRVYLSMLKHDSAAHYAARYLEAFNQVADFNDPSVLDLTRIPVVVNLDREISFVTTGAGLPPFYRLADSSFALGYAADDLRKYGFFREEFDGVRYYHNILIPNYKNVPDFAGFRTPELLLTRAECYARANKPDEALADLNNLCSKRYQSPGFVPYTTHDPQELLQLILLERRKETIGDGSLRWMDLKRLNKEFRNITIRHYDYVNHRYYELPPNDDRYAVPIPTDIIKLTGMQQN